MLLRILGALAVLALLASPVQAFQCPLDVKKIDAALAADPDIGGELKGKVMKLRNKGESLHKKGDHAEAVKTEFTGRLISGTFASGYFLT